MENNNLLKSDEFAHFVEIDFKDITHEVSTIKRNGNFWICIKNLSNKIFSYINIDYSKNIKRNVYNIEN